MLSAVIPALNEAQLIGSCLSSLKNQTIPPSEMIVVDAGSTDRTVEIASKYAIVLHSKIKNVAYQREVGCQQAVGRYILLADADTVFPLDWIEKALENFKNPEVVAVTGNIQPLNPNPITLLNCWFRNQITPAVTQRACCFLFLNPNTSSLFTVDGYVSMQDINPLRARLKGKIVKDNRLTVLTEIPLEQQAVTTLLIAAPVGLGLILWKKRY